MKRIPLLLVVAATTSLSLAQTRLSVSIKGHPAGYATLNQRLQQDGSKIVELRMELASGDRKVKLTSEARYDAKGMPLRKFQQAIIAGGALNKQVIATFGKDGASVTVLDGEKRTIKNVPLTATAPRANLSEFWFIRDTPKVGQVEKAYQFNPDTLAWEIVKTEYKGKKTLKLEGHDIPVHEVVVTRGDQETTSYLDEQGLPVLIDQGDIKMVKMWPK